MPWGMRMPFARMSISQVRNRPVTRARLLVVGGSLAIVKSTSFTALHLRAELFIHAFFKKSTDNTYTYAQTDCASH